MEIPLTGDELVLYTETALGSSEAVGSEIRAAVLEKWASYARIAPIDCGGCIGQLRKPLLMRLLGYTEGSLLKPDLVSLVIGDVKALARTQAASQNAATSPATHTVVSTSQNASHNGQAMAHRAANEAETASRTHGLPAQHRDPRGTVAQDHAYVPNIAPSMNDAIRTAAEKAAGLARQEQPRPQASGDGCALVGNGAVAGAVSSSAATMTMTHASLAALVDEVIPRYGVDWPSCTGTRFLPREPHQDGIRISLIYNLDEHKAPAYRLAPLFQGVLDRFVPPVLRETNKPELVTYRPYGPEELTRLSDSVPSDMYLAEFPKIEGTLAEGLPEHQRQRGNRMRAAIMMVSRLSELRVQVASRPFFYTMVRDLMQLLLIEEAHTLRLLTFNGAKRSLPSLTQKDFNETFARTRMGVPTRPFCEEGRLALEKHMFSDEWAPTAPENFAEWAKPPPEPEKRRHLSPVFHVNILFSTPSKLRKHSRLVWSSYRPMDEVTICWQSTCIPSEQYLAEFPKETRYFGVMSRRELYRSSRTRAELMMVSRLTEVHVFDDDLPLFQSLLKDIMHLLLVEEAWYFRNLSWKTAKRDCPALQVEDFDEVFWRAALGTHSSPILPNGIMQERFDAIHQAIIMEYVEQQQTGSQKRQKKRQRNGSASHRVKQEGRSE